MKKPKQTESAAPVYRLYTSREAAALWHIPYEKFLKLVDEGRIRPILEMKGYRWDGTELASVKWERL